MYTLGLDLSTQSFSATILQQHGDKIVDCGNWNIAFRDLATKYQLEQQTLCLPPYLLPGALNTDGFYAQAPQMFLESLDLLLAKMQAAKAPLKDIAAINCSAQQHGQVWFNENFEYSCDQLQTLTSENLCLSDLFASSYAYPAAPIWMCSQTAKEARHLLQSLGIDQVLQTTGSAAPLRFSGLVMRWLARHAETSYQQCYRIHLLSSWLAALLSGNSASPIDWGNGAGTALMDYQNKVWANELIANLAEGLPGGACALWDKLPPLASPLQCVGTLAHYFTKYGFSADCKILAGSGDNPQTKVCQQGDVLSLGSSFVLMSPGAKLHKWANAMYDGLGQPFSFACRTNGALVWDFVRKQLNLSLVQQSQALEQYPFGAVSPIYLHLMTESFPPQEIVPEGNCQENIQTPLKDSLTPYQNLAAVIDGTLLELHEACRQVFSSSTTSPLYITGGPSQSPQIIRRIEQIWQRPVQTFHSGGASYGAALAAFQRIP